MLSSFIVSQNALFTLRLIQTVVQSPTVLERVVFWPHIKPLHMTAGVTGQLSGQASTTASDI